MTLVECLIALVLAAIVSAAVVSVLSTQNRLLRSLTSRAADAEALRVAAGVLREELRSVEPARDIRVLGGDSVAVRVFRGGGRVCAIVGDQVTIAYDGDRLPAAGKDSLLLQAGGDELAYAVLDVAAAGCGSLPAIRLRTNSPPAPAVHALVFESGSYYVRDRAFRYRLGSAGRQPLTAERFAASGHALHIAPDGSAALVHLRWPSPRAPDTLRIRFLNARP